jgi:hypothetical protein
LYLLLYTGRKHGLSFSEEHRLRVFEKRVLRKVFRPKRIRVTADWMKLHSEELKDLLSSPNIFRSSN